MLTRTRSDRGASAVEYGILVAGVAGALVLGTAVLQSGLASAYDSTTSSIETTPVSTAPSAPTAGPAPRPTPSATTAAPTPTPTPTQAPTQAPVTSPPAVAPSPTPTSVPATTPAPVPTADYRVRQDDAVTMDVLASGTSKTGTPTVSPASTGSVSWKGSVLEFEADEDALPGRVTITYQYKKGSTVYTDTVTVLIERG